jgi:hypothetical protein
MGVYGLLNGTSDPFLVQLELDTALGNTPDNGRQPPNRLIRVTDTTHPDKRGIRLPLFINPPTRESLRLPVNRKIHSGIRLYESVREICSGADFDRASPCCKNARVSVNSETLSVTHSEKLKVP